MEHERKLEVLVSLTGDFHSSVLPVYYNFRHDIERHLLVHDDARSDRNTALRMLRGMMRLKIEEGEGPEILDYELDEDDSKDRKRLVTRIGELCEGDFGRVVLNATDGLASLSIPLAVELQRRGATLIAYDRYDNRYQVVSPDGSVFQRELSHPMNIEAQLTLRDYTILDHTPARDLLGNREHLYSLGADLARYKRYADAHSASRNDPDAVAGFEDIKKRLKALGRERDLKYIQGTLFEEFIALLLEETGWFDEVWTGVKVAFDQELENEFDVLMIKDNHLHTIECKLVGKLDGEHYVYKTDTVMEYLDDDSRAMILSIGAPNERYDRRGRLRKIFSRGDYARAHREGIAIFQEPTLDIKAFLAEVHSWFVRPYLPRSERTEGG